MQWRPLVNLCIDQAQPIDNMSRSTCIVFQNDISSIKNSIQMRNIFKLKKMIKLNSVNGYNVYPSLFKKKNM